MDPTPTTTPRHRRGFRFSGRLTAVAALSIAAFALCRAAPLDYTFSDPWGTLPTAQAILDDGTVRLDAYAESDAIARLGMAYRFEGHIYSYFPLGTSILALPAVAAARRAGLDMTRNADNTSLQRLLAALGVAAAVPLTWWLARAFLPPAAALAATVAFVFGTSTTSTLGTALWSSLVPLLLHLVILNLLVRGRLAGHLASPVTAYLAGGLLFVAFACRPTAALFALAVGVYVLYVDRFAALRLGLGFGVGLALLAVFSLSEYGQVVPPYYQAGRLGSETFATALVGNLVSPSRGVLVLSPFLLLVIVGAIHWRRQVIRDRWFLFGSAWALLHGLTVSSYHLWWGGWCFGNRFFADAMPAWWLMALVVARQAQRTLGRRALVYAATTAGCLTLAAVWIHSVQGLYNTWTSTWCQDGTYVRHLFDWRHPQWLASPASLAAHRRQHLLAEVDARSPLEPILPADRDLLFEGWSRSERGGDEEWRWSDGEEAAILLRLDVAELERLPSQLRLVVEAGTYQAQEIDVEIQGERVGKISSSKNWEPGVYRFALPRPILERGRSIRSSRVVEITFRIPGARRPADDDPQGDGDTRRLGICLRRAMIEAAL